MIAKPRNTLTSAKMRKPFLLDHNKMENEVGQEGT